MDDVIKNPVGPFALPKEIAEAVVTVIQQLGVLSKDQTNNFDRYEYASIDDFIKFVRKDASDSGLFFITQEAREPELKELRTKKGDPLMMWSARFAFYICHKSGAVSDAIFKTVMVQANGAQAAGSAQSYGLKQLMRGLFLIPTGDKDDPDKMETAEYTASQAAPNRLQSEAGRIKSALERADSEKKVRAAWNSNGIVLEEIRGASSTAYAFLEGVRDDQLKKFDGEQS